MGADDSAIRHVTDTAIWVAHYRALESERPDALFRDPLAKLLVGDRGKAIAARMGKTSTYTQWSVVIRTVVIDRLLQNLVSGGVDTVINLGAGLDTRPYRLALPTSLRWIEVDYPDTVERKNEMLANEEPSVSLERVGLDLSDRQARSSFLTRICADSKSSLILTEGVVPYLSPAEVGSLADDLRQQASIQYWIAEYYTPAVYPYLRSRRRKQIMKKAPFQFFPENWFGFFRSHGWIQREIKYLPEEANKLNRGMQFPWWVRVLHALMSRKRKGRWLQSMGYVVYGKVEAYSDCQK